ncbi:MAG: ERF family protein [Bacteroidales bacterium]|nr:ERF family protein [Candidatus Latescibacterota bacterium]
MSEQTTPLIHAQMCKIQRDADGLTKGQQNQQQGFKYRGIDDAYNYLHDIFAKHDVFTVPRVTNMEREERLSKAGSVLMYTMLTVEYDFFANDGSSVTTCVIGEAMDSGDKSCNKALSIAHKLALFQITMLPTLLSADADAEVHTPMPKPPEEKPEPETPMAVRDQLAALSDFRAEHKTTMEENDYIDGQGERLTYKQADQLLDRIKDRQEKDK